MKGNPLYWRKVKEFHSVQIFDGIQLKYYFENGLAASVVCHKHSYGGEHGEFEVALMDYVDNLIYHEEFIDVVGYLTFAQVDECLSKIAYLKPLFNSKPLDS
jgi:hypothetical protein